ncbi:DUF3139 domain-containing protein [Bacillus toyonensis]|uniref:DUF3139 domain-containing protein n=1 Tax=Bacillus toyonensis TaxID=155322 RepID=UPI0015D4C22B
MLVKKKSEKKQLSQRCGICKIKGYKESDILYIKPAFYSKMDSYGMNVQFKDEPNESYTYRVLKDAKTNKLTVHQDSNEPGGMGGKQQELK